MKSITNILYDNCSYVVYLNIREQTSDDFYIIVDNFTQYTTANGLSNNTLYAVYEDSFNNLWLPSNYGLMCFNKQTLSTKVYLPKHGIHSGC